MYMIAFLPAMILSFSRSPRVVSLFAVFRGTVQG